MQVKLTLTDDDGHETTFTAKDFNGKHVWTCNGLVPPPLNKTAGLLSGLTLRPIFVPFLQDDDDAEPPSDDHGRSKYKRTIWSIDGASHVIADVYCVIEGFMVTCPARAHAIKKLLCAGIRGKGDAIKDLKETIVAVERAIQLEERRQR